MNCRLRLRHDRQFGKKVEGGFQSQAWEAERKPLIRLLTGDLETEECDFRVALIVTGQMRNGGVCANKKLAREAPFHTSK